VTEPALPEQGCDAALGHLNAARCGLAASTQALWVGYLGLGGGAPLAQVERWLAGTDPLPDREHNLLAQTLNDWLIDGGTSERFPYADAPKLE